MVTGETIWAGCNVMAFDVSPFGQRYDPEEPGAVEDVDRSRGDGVGTGWDQALRMDRQPVDRATQPLEALALPIGIPMTRDYVALYLERNQGNNSGQVAPLLRSEVIGNRFGSPVNLIEWAPSPEYVVSQGRGAPVRDDVVPTIAKMSIDGGYFGVIDTQQLLDEAIARTRRAMFGR